MALQFEPLTDLPHILAVPIDAMAIQLAKQEACRQVAAELPVAARVYSVNQHIAAFSADTFLRELVWCAVAADCWNARMTCPRTGAPSPRWQEYVQAQVASACALLPDALARCVVAEHVPLQWIPEAQVRMEIVSKAAALGGAVEVLEMSLAPPVLGGCEWVRAQCAQGWDALLELAREAPVAAVLHWHHRTAAAVVACVNGHLHAFGPSLTAEGCSVEITHLIGAAVMSPRKVPPSNWQRLAQWLGVRVLLWKWIRFWRLRVGGRRVAIRSNAIQ